MTEQRVVLRFLPQGRYFRTGLVQVPEPDSLGRAGGSAGGDHLALADLAVLLFGALPCSADALHAISAFLHHAAAAHRYLWIALRGQHLGTLVLVFFAIRIAEEIEAPDLVGAVRLAEACAD